MSKPGAHRHTVDWALHIDEWDEAISICDGAVGPNGLHSVARITSGVTDFTVDAFDELGVGEPEALRQACRGVARLVTSLASVQDEKLDEVRTGRLIRFVLHGDRGAILCFSVVPGQFLVGFTLAPVPDGVRLTAVPEVQAADETMAGLVLRLRRRLGLGSQNPGGFEPADRPSSDRSVPVVEGPVDRAEYGPIEAAVDPADLHLVAFKSPYADELVVDRLGHPLLSRFFGLTTVESRRKFYRDLARELPKTAGQAGRLVRASLDGALLRLVLDVEQGAVYCYRMSAGHYLIGVTLDQTQVATAEEKLARLALDLADLP